MKIISFSYFDKTRNWGFENLEFSKLTLLVGASGVGKTQILRAIENLKKIADGKSLNGIRWEVNFEALNGKAYNWKGEFEDKKHSLLEATIETEENPIILYEQLTEGGKAIIERDKKKLIYQGKETVKLAAYQSAIILLRAEEKIGIVANEIDCIKILEMNVVSFSYNIPENLLEKLIARLSKTMETEKKLFTLSPPILKLLLASSLADKSHFQSIKKRYIDIFPQIEDIQVVSRKQTILLGTAERYSHRQVVLFKEKGVKEWIEPENMSSGMLRSLMQLIELYLCPEGSVLLMDEFENSLGVNCIDELTNDILSSKRNIQFILTSHHPYIINNIPYQNWKIVTRKAGKVTVKNASDYRIGESKHDYFMQLLQLEAFSNGVD